MARVVSPSTGRTANFSDELPPEFFTGLVGEVYNPAKNRFVNRRGARNEPLDTWVYAFAAAHHPELRLHRYTKTDWERAEARLEQTSEPVSAAPVHVPSRVEPLVTPPEPTQRRQSPATAFLRSW